MLIQIYLKLLLTSVFLLCNIIPFEAMNEFVCNICPFTADCFHRFQKHYVKFHQNDPHFFITCSVGACGYSTNKWVNFRVHVHRKHTQILLPQRVEEATSLSDSELDEDVLGEDLVDPSFANSQFTLALEAQHNVSKVAIDKIISSMSQVIDSHVEHFKVQMKRKLQDVGIDPSIVDSIPIASFVEGLETDRRRQNYYSKHLSTLIPPKPVVLGSKFVFVKGEIKQVKPLGYIVPFAASLKNLLEMPEVWQHIETPHVSSDEYMHDICDGKFIREHPLFVRNPRAIQIILSCDDLELVNPLGSHVKKHKLTLFYYTIANIPPQYRSKLTAIALLAICKTPDIHMEFSEKKLLRDFVDTVNQLSNGGIDMVINGRSEMVEGALVMVCADTLGAHWLGKFKEGVGFALKKCRVCEEEGQSMSRLVTESQVRLRTNDTHRERCDTLTNVNMSKDARKYWSKLWGINGKSVLMDVVGFNLIGGLVQDPMHVLLEGVVPRDFALALYSFVYVDKMFTLKWLNCALTKFRYSYLHSKSKPEKIDKVQLTSKGSIKQTASAMLTLCHTLPVIVGSRIPQNHAKWQNMLRLIQIVLLCTSPSCTRETAVQLRLLIAEYLTNFIILYPKASFIPKMHYLIHLPQQMLIYGPTRHHWCMRFEGKHGFFTHKRWKNFKNIPLSLANKHQLYMAYMQCGDQGCRSDSFLYEGDVIGEGSVTTLAFACPDLDNLSNFPPDVYMTAAVILKGLEYKVGCALVLGYDNDDEPNFGLVEHIIVKDGEVHFVVHKTDSHYVEHIVCYELECRDSSFATSYNQMQFKWPLSVYTYADNKVVMNVCSHLCTV